MGLAESKSYQARTLLGHGRRILAGQRGWVFWEGCWRYQCLYRGYFYMTLRSQQEMERMSYQGEGAPNFLKDGLDQIVLPSQAFV